MKKKIPYIAISLSIALVVVVLAIFDIYDTIEHKLLDIRFNSRGLIETRDDIATLDIDVRALQKEGKWDPWSREKHLPMVEAAAQHGMNVLAFDIYFIENSERELNYKSINNITDSLVTIESVKGLFPNPDNDLASAASKAGNIYFAQSFKPQPKKREKIKLRTADQDERLEAMTRKKLFREVNPEDYSTIFNFYDGEFPLTSFVDSSAGVYFFQAKSDKDGVMRKYPLIGLYENRLFPSVTLSIALDHYNVSFDDVEIVPGKYLRFKPSTPDEFGREMITIPINKEGMMQVNWAGNWEDAEGNFDLMHYPYNVLKDFQKNEYSNYVLAEFKRITNLSFSGNVKAAYKPAMKLIDAEKKEILDAVKKTMMMGAVESWILQNPNGTVKDFKKVPPFVFNEIKNNNIIASSFLDNLNETLDDLIKQKKVLFDTNLEEYSFRTVSILRADLKKELTNPDQKENAKGLKKTLADLALIERNYQIIENLDIKQLASNASELDVDDALDLIEDLQESDKEVFLDNISETERKLIQEGLNYPEDSAGRLMQREFVSINDEWNVGDAIDFLRKNKSDLPEDFYEIYLLNNKNKISGIVPLGRLMGSKRSTVLFDIKNKNTRTIHVLIDQEEVAYQFNKYAMVSAPVINEKNEIIGSITVDDVVNVIEEEREVE